MTKGGPFHDNWYQELKLLKKKGKEVICLCFEKHLKKIKIIYHQRYRGEILSLFVHSGTLGL